MKTVVRNLFACLFIILRCSNESTAQNFEPQYELIELPDTISSMYEMAFATDSIGFVSTFEGLWRTSDAGHTWQLINSSGYGLHVLDSINVYVVQRSGIILHSRDAGITWEYNHIERPCLKCFFMRVFFLDTMFGFAEGGYEADPTDPDQGEGISARTTDGGLNWISNSHNNSYRVDQLVYTDTLHGFVLRPYVYETLDGGETWSNAPDIVRGSESIYYMGDGKVIAAGALSTDFGRNWSPAPLIENLISGHRQVVFATTMQFRDSVFRSEDGGQTWDYLTKLSFNAWKISVPSDNVAYISGNRHLINNRYNLLRISSKSNSSVRLRRSDRTSPICKQGTQYPLEDNRGFQLFNLLGLKVAQSSEPTEYLYTSELAPGLYLLRVGEETQRLLIY